MAYSQETYEIMAGALGAMPGLTEKKMFGGICFLLNGNMLAGVMKNGAMARVGKEREPEAVALDGVEPLAFTGRRMGGLVRLAPEVVEDEARLVAVLDMALAFVGPLPAK